VLRVKLPLFFTGQSKKIKMGELEFETGGEVAPDFDSRFRGIEATGQTA